MSDPIGPVFAALADPTRRHVVETLVREGSTSVPALSAVLPITRQAIAKHLAVLREAGLVSPHRAGRETRFSATTSPMAAASRWLDVTGAAWDDRLARLAARLDERTHSRDGPAGRE
jgi:ArsR family transcriptional regulator, cadmium/lead-responsive transcriptional repressor